MGKWSPGRRSRVIARDGLHRRGPWLRLRVLPASGPPGAGGARGLVASGGRGSPGSTAASARRAVSRGLGWRPLIARERAEPPAAPLFRRPHDGPDGPACKINELEGPCAIFCTHRFSFPFVFVLPISPDPTRQSRCESPAARPRLRHSEAGPQPPTPPPVARQITPGCNPRRGAPDGRIKAARCTGRFWGESSTNSKPRREVRFEGTRCGFQQATVLSREFTPRVNKLTLKHMVAKGPGPARARLRLAMRLRGGREGACRLLSPARGICP